MANTMIPPGPGITPTAGDTATSAAPSPSRQSRSGSGIWDLLFSPFGMKRMWVVAPVPASGTGGD